MPNEFKSTLPDRKELMRLSPYEGSRRTLQAFSEAREEMKRRGYDRATIEEIAALLNASASTYQTAVQHCEAVDVYKISPNLPKQEAIRRMRLVNPLAQRLSRDLDRVEDQRSDAELLSDGVSSVLVRAGDELPRLDAGVLATYLRRDPAKLGSTRSALVDLQRWLSALGRALDGPLQDQERS